MNKKNVILNQDAQWSLTLFLGSFVINIITMWLLAVVSEMTSIHSSIIFIPPVITIFVYLISIFLGVCSLKISKFPLVWVVPCSVMVVVLIYTVSIDLTRTFGSGNKTSFYDQAIVSNKSIGVAISENPETPTLIEAVFYKSPAEVSGIMNGDQIVSIEGIKVNSRQDIVTTLNMIADSTVEITVMRDNSTTTIDVDRELEIQ